ncbi:hypothetical protein BpHYR1_040386 [Brachionus plicatilis]|uniref:Transmembrane protein n=1 Tax=Brachionus plicatilis TaxID=10195 RepID=A0A3M7RB22_BRAPC|nr:hypothetical protein BpHYR1_040386 [Brachionus plicatilis]
MSTTMPSSMPSSMSSSMPTTNAITIAFTSSYLMLSLINFDYKIINNKALIQIMSQTNAINDIHKISFIVKDKTNHIKFKIYFCIVFCFTSHLVVVVVVVLAVTPNM